MATSFVNYTGDGSTTEFNFSFPYLNADYVKAYLDGDIASSYTVGVSSVVITPAPAMGVEVLIKRETASEVLVDFVSGATLTEADLDTSFRQALHKAVEASEANLGLSGGAVWDADNRRLVNLADPTNSTDAVNRTYVDTLALYGSGASVPQAWELTGTGDDNTFTLETPDPAGVSNEMYVISVDGILQAPSTNDLSTIRDFRVTEVGGVYSLTFEANSFPSNTGNTDSPPDDAVINVQNFGIARSFATESSTVKATGSSAYRTLGDRFANVANVKDFGAIGDGVADDTAAIQAALTYAFSHAEPFPSVYLPSGNYKISDELDRSGNGNYVDIYGDGQRNTIITVDASADLFNSVLYLADSGDVAGRTTVRDLTINCSDKAIYGIDAQSMRFWTLQNVEIKSAQTAGVMGGNWSTDILNNKFDDNPIGFFLKNHPDHESSANGFRFDGNYVGTCPIGFKTDSLCNDISITNNLFDNCDDVGVWISEGCRKGTIDNNYFEGCATETGVTVAIAAGTEVMAAPIILGYDPGSPLTTVFSGSVDKNYFVSNCEDRLIAAYNLENLSVLKNELLNTDETAAFLELREQGSGNSYSGGVEIRGYYPGVTQLVALEGLDEATSHCNLVVDARDLAADRKPLWFINNPTVGDEWTGDDPTINTSWYGGLKEFEFDVETDGERKIRTLEIDFETLEDHALLGRYVRVHYSTVGSTPTFASGVWCQLYVDDVEVLGITRTSADDYIEAGRSITIYIPSGAEKFKVNLRGVYDPPDKNAKMIGFCICDAAYPINSIPIAQS